MRAIDWHSMWVPEWSPWEVAIRSAIVYAGVQLLLRLAGRRELGRHSTFDVAILFLVSTAMRRTMVGEDGSLTSAFVALGTMVALDMALSYVTSRRRRIASVVKGDPVQLVRDGALVDDALRKVHISTDELLSWARQHGMGSLGEIRHAFLEPSGQVSIIGWPMGGRPSAWKATARRLPS
ncbi:MAG TPA: YetF domain-containing protein [Myxococcales bacterium]|jgi:uncharacterized membrane protein YcaP (DUF421 family)|nr:YetF domain-containing protein [Myxococcales bacterium]